MVGLFLNPGFLFIAGALIAVPIIIHLINRMRFKRIRWAAMEFLLKAQKRTRRRLIIEQLLLLALRCLLIALVGLLVSRFIGCGDTNMTGKPNLHLVLLDDTLSMRDFWKHEGQSRNAFDVAKTDVLVKEIAKGLSMSKTNDRLMILPLSKVDDPSFDEKEQLTYERLNDPGILKKATQEILELEPSKRHIPLIEGVKRAQKIMANYPDSTITLHLIGDFRDKDWSRKEGEALTKQLLELVKDKKGEVKIGIVDTVMPARAGASNPPARDNVGIIDVRPSTRMVGKNMPVQFSVTLHNFGGKEIQVIPIVRDEVMGKDLSDVDFRVADPSRAGDGKFIKIPAGMTTVATFERRFNPQNLAANESHFAHISVRLANGQLGPLENDALLEDNERHSFVEVRDKVPILVIDSDIERRREGREKDSFFVSRGLISVPGGNYEIVFGDELAPGTPGAPAKALERTDLHKFPTIFMLNVPDLSPKQVTSLENYVKEGGGVAFFLGPLVNADHYNRFLHKEGQGVFPAPLKKEYYPPPLEKELPEKEGDTFELLTRDDKFAKGQVPIFDRIFEDPRHREPLRALSVRRYFQVNRSAWKPELNKVFELATLPNDAQVVAYGDLVAGMTRGGPMQKVLANPDLAVYKARLQFYLRAIEATVRPGSEKKAYHLAAEIESLLSDKGNPGQKEGGNPDMTAFWGNPDSDVQALRSQFENLRQEVQYGDPFIVINNAFGQGKVAAIMTTAGKDWNNWAGGSAASVLYAPFIWELQNYLSSSGSDANLTVGMRRDISFDTEQFKGMQLSLVRYFKIAEQGKEYKNSEPFKERGNEDKGRVHFTLRNHNKPGVYLTELVDDNAPGKAPLARFAHVFNVDTDREGPLDRVSSEVLKRELDDPSKGLIKLRDPNERGTLIPRVNDLSESPWLFLMFLLVLVAEQALAVHLSFHMKQDDQALSPAGVKV